MAENLLSPRLRNSSINGTRFHMDLDPTVKSHLAELNRILGMSAFSEKPRHGIDELKNLTKESEAATYASNTAESAARSADDTAREAENKFAQAKGEAMQVKNIKAALKNTNGEELKKLEAEEKEKDEAAAKAEKDARVKREAANAAAKAYKQKREEADRLSQQLAAKSLEAFRSGGQRRRPQFDLEDELEKPIIAKKTNAPKWDKNGFVAAVLDMADPALLSISDCIDKVNELSNLKNSLLQYVHKHWNSLEENQKAVLNNKEYKNISDYLLAYGYWVKGITEVSAMFNFIRTHKFGSKAIINYAVVSSARTVIEKASLEIRNIDDDDHPLLKNILSADLSFNEESFSKDLEKIFKTFIDNAAELKLIRDGLNQLKIDDLPPSYIPAIIRYMRSSKVEIDGDNITYFLPIFINKIKGDLYQEMEETEEDVEESDRDFDVEFVEDDKTTIKTSVSNVKCASQLFSAAIMETELDIFNLTNYLTNSYLIRNRIDLEDQRLRQNLEMFVFSNKFRDIKTGQIRERTKEGERHHFYRQVFNIGAGPLPEGVIMNHKFPRLWNQLIPAVKDYLENAASSLSENTFVSKGGVMQVVSGLQNNLSANCTSMAKIISPIINGEWNFIIGKILGHPEIVKQVSPSIGSWKGVAETLFSEMKQKYTDATLVYDKVKLSNAILKKIAAYVPREFEDDEKFMDFCSMVIQLDDLNASIATEVFEETDDDVDMNLDQYSSKNGKPSGNKPPQTANTGNSDWDF